MHEHCSVHEVVKIMRLLIGLNHRGDGKVFTIRYLQMVITINTIIQVLQLPTINRCQEQADLKVMQL